jgi:ATP-dependent helicase YprA (DUF1998 family)
MSFSPVTASKEIVVKYQRYLSTIFQIKDKKYSELFKNALEHGDPFYSGPYLDVTNSFETGESINDMVFEGRLSRSFERAKLPINRKLYRHQVNAIHKVLSNENIVVSTGTGSGKTESFLIPILNHLMRQLESGLLKEGVRALIIYPMNALANDQTERLRGILTDFPEITFGSYTGQTDNTYKLALAKYKKLNNDQNPIPNELISREQMHRTPPHILITNYSMLEYLLLRPSSSIFFSDEYSHLWKYIVLDEAHVYSGSTGIEVSYLLRRLKTRLHNEQLNYILTSATLGDEKDNIAVANFASDLCDSNFSNNNVIRAIRKDLQPYKELDLVPESFYFDVAEMLNNGEEELKINDYLEEKYPEISGNNIEEKLFELLLHDDSYWKIRQFLTEPSTVEKIANLLKWSTKQVEDFVTVATKCSKGDVRLFDARYHMFIKSTESVFITLPPYKKVLLSRQQSVEENGISYRAFEIVTCMFCHEIYILGAEKDGFLIQSSFSDDESIKQLFLLRDKISNEDEDMNAQDFLETNPYQLCPQCGKLTKIGVVDPEYCEHDKSNFSIVQKVKLNKNSRLTKCLACENTSSKQVVRTFYAGHEAVSSILSTALYEALPSYKINYIRSNTGRTGFGNIPVVKKQLVRESKQFLTFSDSRQAAAFFAIYLKTTYQSILYRRVLVECLNKDSDEYPITFDKFVKEISGTFKKHSILTVDNDVEAVKAILKEMTDNEVDYSLHKLGLIAFRLSDDFSIPYEYKSSQNDLSVVLAPDQVKSIFEYFILNMIANSSVETNYKLTDEDYDYFTFEGKRPNFSFSDSSKYIMSFIPTKEKGKNKRFDFIYRTLEKEYPKISRLDVTIIMKEFWNHMIANDILVRSVRDQLECYRVDTSKILIDRPCENYKCSKCNNITPFNIMDSCPTLNCDGVMERYDLQKEYKDNHYYRLYNDLEIRDIKVEEHTAQLSREKAYDFQRRFVNKEIDILSCSTTFEMGVDVGTLETVFMRNVPPSPANYAQRAGRAGRSRLAAAYALTMCNRSSHDFTYFRRPKDMIKGKIRPPRFNIFNEKIAIRHIYATALASFWLKFPDFFDDAEKMVEENGVEEFRKYLETQPIHLKESIKRFLPEQLHSTFGVDGFEWIERLYGDEGSMTLGVNEYKEIIQLLEEARKKAIEAGKKSDSYLYRMKTYRKEDVLSFLSKRNVLPKYGFPVDTVELSIDNLNTPSLGIELQRDLSVAISEFAPDSEIVANGKMIKSRYIKKIRSLDWKQFAHKACKYCKTLNIIPYIDEEYTIENLKICRACQSELSGSYGIFIEPSFGFIADPNSGKDAGTKKPERTTRTEVAYVGSRESLEFIKFKIGESTVSLGFSSKDKMAVLNTSTFHICNVCGYGEVENLDVQNGMNLIKKHETSSSMKCNNEFLQRRNIGYQFETDVVILSFEYPDVAQHEEALSILYSVVEGVCKTLNIEKNDVSGCLNYHYNEYTRRGNYDFVLYDNTPGGSGYVKQIRDSSLMEDILREALRVVKDCDCGGDDLDSSCYGCLRSYQNQRYHDYLKRKYVVNFFEKMFSQTYEDHEPKGFNPWLSLRRFIVDQNVINLIEYFSDSNVELPEVGYEFDFDVYADAEIAWPKHKIAILSSYQKGYKALLEADGWITFDCAELDIKKYLIIKELLNAK